MFNPFTKLARGAASRKGAPIVLACWLLIILLLSAVAPSAKPYAVSSNEGSIREDKPSAVAQAVLNEHFPAQDGSAALLVFHAQQAITADERAVISALSTWLSSNDKPEHVVGAVPFHQLPPAAQDKLLSEDRTTLLLNVSLAPKLESGQVYDTLKQIRTHAEQAGLGGMQLEITGPAGIAADVSALFKQADFVLMFATIGLILVILIVIYRSPLLAVIPLVIAGMVYAVVDRVLGIAASNGWFVVDKQALSIMMILLFAVLTDYCLFVCSRYREELRWTSSKYEAMQAAMTHVAEPIWFSGGTVLAAMLTLFVTVFKPYHNFAPVFSVAMAVILLGGLTLIPAVFAWIGPKAFWPFAPKPESSAAPSSRLWTKVGSFVTRRSAFTAAVLLILLVAASIQALGINYSFNLMKSFPDHISSRVGFELLEERFPQGQLAPVKVVLESSQAITADSTFAEKFARLEQKLQAAGGISAVQPSISPETLQSPAKLPANWLSQDQHAVQFQVVLADNPYDQSALNLVQELRERSAQWLRDSGFDPATYTLHFGGQTAQQLDVRDMNQRDTWLACSLIALFIGILLAIQSRSIVLALFMAATILLSYAATLGLAWMLFHYLWGYDAISYRLPMYTFVFLVALGVDYNIMLVSRIKEEAKRFEWKEAVQRGVASTGGVISSAGMILAATFCVLITQPLQELVLFGVTMAIGIVMDTFLVRGMLLPAILTGAKRLYPSKPDASKV